MTSVIFSNPAHVKYFVYFNKKLQTIINHN